ncbi:MAG: SIMPL domain-containing protein [Candidatus Cardinium sp.]
MNTNKIQAAIILSIGLVVSSMIFGLAFCYVRSKSVAYISVKGLAEREVDANVGIWTIRFEAIDHDLEQVNRQITNQTEILVGFLRQKGFVDKEIIYGTPELSDHGKYDSKSCRYSIKMEIIVHTPNVFLIYETVQKSQELVKMGVCLRGHWDGLIKFIFTDLNTIKPSMIQEATINVKKAAHQLAADSDVRLGILRRAVQGVFSIEDTHLPTKKRCV